MKKKIFAMLALAFLLALSMAPAAWAATVDYAVIGGIIQFDTETGTVTGANVSITEANIPSMIEGVAVTKIGNGAFNNCVWLKNVSIPNSVTSIGDKAFAGTRISEFNISKNVTSIGKNAFDTCGASAFIVDTDNPNYSSEYGVLFDKDKTRLIQYPENKEAISYKVPDSVKKIDSKAFANNMYLTAVIMPEDMDNIGEAAFANCRNLKTVNIPKGLTEISGQLFYCCENLSSEIVIPDGVITIGGLAFFGCHKIQYITLPESLISIENNAFGGCSSITTLKIPANLSIINHAAFYDCTKLNSIIVSDESTNFSSQNGVLFNKEKTILLCYPAGKTDENYIVPATVHTIVSSAFTSNSFLKNVTVSDKINKIDGFTFSYDINLTSITIPNSVTDICKGAFFRVDNLKDVYYSGSQEEWLGINIDYSSQPYSHDNEALKNATIHYNSTGPEKPDTIPVTGITLDKTALTMEVKTTAQLKATVLPADTTSTISWTSSNEQVATVDNTGKVTALTKGTATITAVADGIKAECVVTVTADDVYTITFDTDGGTLAAGITNPDYVIKGETYKMPGASKSRYTLTAWAIGGKDSQTQAKANDVYTFTEDTTVYAIWQYNGGGSHGGSSRPSGTTTIKPGTTEKPGDTNKPGTTTDNNKTVTAANVNNKFADVQNNAWYSEAIAYVYNKGMMNGTDAGKFEPDATTTRAMLVTMLFRLEGEPKAGAADFSDVASGQWFSEAIAWAAANGVVNGYKDGTFAPNDMITREQLAAVLYRFAQFKGYDVSVKGSLSNFSDSGSVSDWAQEAMQWAVGAGIINGDNGALKPAGNATRAEVAMMLMRFCENVAK